MSTNESKSEIDFIKSIVQKTNQRIDAQAFHFVHWGLIVLLWYPTSNYLTDQWVLLEDDSYGTAAIVLGIAAVALGIILSAVRGARAAGRLVGENTFISKQVVLVTFGCILGGMILSGVAPTSKWISGQNVPIIWGLTYANLAFMMGVVYNRDFLISGVCIFGGSIAAMYLPSVQSYILGPVMGFGMIIPGLRAEARVRGVMRQTKAEVAA